jgi:hypothetical protein
VSERLIPGGTNNSIYLFLEELRSRNISRSSTNALICSVASLFISFFFSSCFSHYKSESHFRSRNYTQGYLSISFLCKGNLPRCIKLPFLKTEFLNYTINKENRYFLTRAWNHLVQEERDRPLSEISKTQ